MRCWLPTVRTRLSYNYRMFDKESIQPLKKRLRSVRVHLRDGVDNPLSRCTLEPAQTTSNMTGTETPS